MAFDFSFEELNFIVNNECCRLATSVRNRPHVVPVCYIFMDGCFFISTDYSTKKLKDINNNPLVSLVVDEYVPQNHKGIVICGDVEIIERGEPFTNIYTGFFNKFDWVRKDPWTEGQAPFLKIKPYSKVSWGLKN